MVMGVTRENTILGSYYEVADAPRFKLEGSWLRFKYKPARLQLIEPAIFVSNVSLLPQLIEPPKNIHETELEPHELDSSFKWGSMVDAALRLF